MLILFDIDGTLLSSEGVGRASMLAAGQELFGSDFTFDGVDVSGRLDTLIWHDLAVSNSVEPNDTNHTRFRRTYAKYLEQNLRISDRTRALPGVGEFVAELRQRTDLTLGLLTGNYPETGRMKIRAVSIEPSWFPVQAWGDQAATRRGLPPLAMTQCAEIHGNPIDSRQVLIIGDTPHDVDCAAVNGCRSLAVCTGAFSEDELHAARPDRLVRTLENTVDLVEWIDSLRDSWDSGERSPIEGT